MSTRSALAYIPDKKKDEWVGIYCHWDGYPTNRGKQIWDILQKDFIGNKGETGVQNDLNIPNAIRSFCEIYIKGHPAGWSSFPDKCFCHDPAFVMRDGVQKSEISNKNADPLFMEWVYILDAENAKLKILASKSNEKWDKENKDRPKVRETPVLLENGYWDYGHCQFKHEVVANIDLLGPEPDWEAIEEGVWKDEK